MNINMSINNIKRISKKVITTSFATMLIIAIMFGFFDNSQVKATSNGSRIQIGQQMIISGGYIATCIGYASNGEPIYQSDMSIPIYKDDLRTKIDTTWHLNSDGTYTNGADNFTSTVDSQTVSIQQGADNASWCPNVSVTAQINIRIGMSMQIFTESNVLIASNSGTPILLSVDPLNSNYTNNTLQWDLGNGVYRNLRLIQGEEEEYYTITEPLNGDITIQTNEVNTGITANPIIAYDSENPPQNIQVIVDDEGNITIAQSDLDNMTNLTYPITIDPPTSFTATASDAMTLNSYTGGSDLFSTMIGATSAVFASGLISSTIALGNWNSSGTWGGQVARSYLYFDTTGLTGYTVTAATISLYGSYNVQSISGTWNIQVQNGQPIYPHDPFVTADFNASNYTGNGGGIASTAMTNGQYDNITLNSTGIGWINTTGETKFCLREAEHDIGNTDPSSSYFGQGNYFYFYDYGQGTGYQPQLIVTFTGGSQPTVNSIIANSVGSTTATLNATVTSMGTYSQLYGYFIYGTSPTLVTSTATSPTTSIIGGTNFSANLTGLTPTTTYYYAAVLSLNSNGTSPLAYGTIMSFIPGSPTITTLAANPTEIDAVLNGNLSSLGSYSYAVVSFDWGINSTQLSNATPTQSFNTATSFTAKIGSTASPLVSGITYYFQAVGIIVNSSGVQQNLSGLVVSFITSPQQLVPVTSQPYAPTGGSGDNGNSNTVPPLVQPTTWWANGGSMSSLPFYADFDSAANGMNPNNPNVSQGGTTPNGQPHPTTMVLYLMAIMATAMAAGYGVILFTGSSLLALGVIAITMGVGASMTIISGWMVFLILIGGGGLWMLAKYI